MTSIGVRSRVHALFPLAPVGILFEPADRAAHRLVVPACPLGEDAVELSHPARQVGLECFDKQVIVVGHQAPCMDAPVEAYTHGAENIDQGVPVGVIETDSVATISP